MSERIGFNLITDVQSTHVEYVVSVSNVHTGSDGQKQYNIFFSRHVIIDK